MNLVSFTKNGRDKKIGSERHVTIILKMQKGEQTDSNTWDCNDGDEFDYINEISEKYSDDNILDKSSQT